MYVTPVARSFLPVVDPMRLALTAFYITVAAVFLLPAGKAGAGELQWYTIQAGSSPRVEDAQRLFATLAAKLPLKLQGDLRVEHVGSYFTTRVGRATEKKALRAQLEAVRRLARDAIILRAYIRPQRIVLGGEAPAPAPARQAPVKASTPKQTSTPSAVKTVKATKTAPAPAATRKTVPQIPKSKLHIKPPPEVRFKNVKFPQAKPPKAEKHAPAPPPKETNAPASPQPGSKAYKQLLIEKYLGSAKRPKENKKRRLALADKFAPTAACLANGCHQKLLADKTKHYPARTARCLACHQQTGARHPSGGTDFTPTKDGAGLCYQCHPKFEGAKSIHQPVREGKCTTCHNPHSAPKPFLLTVGMERQEKLCLTCHDQEIIEQRKLHGPVGLGTCTYCHNPHESDQDALLRQEPRRLCESCHNAIAKGIKESPHVHSVMKTEGCTSCHNPHGSRYDNLLDVEGEQFCFTCHQDIKDDYDKARSKHGAMYLDDKCGTCHFPHFSQQPALLNRKEYDLCLNCHSEDNPVRSKSPKNIRKELMKPYLHKPVADGDCSLCHNPHGSKNAKLLVGPYPGTFYAPYKDGEYDLCFDCHDEELLTEKKTEATGFRNGTRNLHYVHVHKERKGRTCEACHQPHASDGPKLINQLGATFGEWTMNIDFTTSGTGGTCTPGCHRTMEYDREHPVDNAAKEGSYGKQYILYEGHKIPRPPRD